MTQLLLHKADPQLLWCSSGDISSLSEYNDGDDGSYYCHLKLRIDLEC